VALAETAKLLASLGLEDKLTPALKKASGSLDKFDTRLDKSSTRAFRAGQQIGTGIKVGLAVGAAALTGLAGLLIVSAKEGQEAAKVQNVYATAIANSGKVTAANVAALNAQQDALLKLTGTDDEVIKAQQTRLIQMGLTGAQVEKLTPLIFDLAASGYDLESSTKAVAKAAQGSNTALQKMGIIVPKGGDGIAILNQRFKGTAAALSGGLDVRLKVLNERLANLREAAGQKLLPALTRIVDVVADKLVPAFGTFIDAIMPSVLEGLDKLSGYLEGGGATTAITKMLAFAKSAAPVIQSAASATLTIIQTAVGLFSSLPPEIQGLAVAGLTINKLTGGLVTNLAGGLISAVISSFKGLMNVNAATVIVNGGVGGVPGVPVAGTNAATRAVGLVSKVFMVGIAAEAADMIHGLISPGGGLENRTNTGTQLLGDTLEWPFGPKNTPHLDLGPFKDILRGDSQFVATPGLAALTTPPPNLAQDAAESASQRRNAAFTSNPTRQELRVKVRDLEKLKPTKDTQRAITSLQNRLQNRIDAEKKRIADAVDASSRAIVAAVKAAGPQPVYVTVPVTTNINGRVVDANLNRYQSITGDVLSRG
jgi:hypothetical protein